MSGFRENEAKIWKQKKNGLKFDQFSFFSIFYHFWLFFLIDIFEKLNIAEPEPEPEIS